MDPSGAHHSQRPGCITAFVVFLWTGAALYLPASLLTGLGILGEVSENLAIRLGAALLLALFAIVPVATGIGLWRMARWGWWLAVCLVGLATAGMALNIALALLAVGRLEEGSMAIPLVCVGLFGLGVGGGLLSWFIRQRHLFNESPR